MWYISSVISHSKHSFHAHSLLKKCLQKTSRTTSIFASYWPKCSAWSVTTLAQRGKTNHSPLLKHSDCLTEVFTVSPTWHTLPFTAIWLLGIDKSGKITRDSIIFVRAKHLLRLKTSFFLFFFVFVKNRSTYLEYALLGNILFKKAYSTKKNLKQNKKRKRKD